MTLVPQDASLRVTAVQDDPWWERALTDMTTFRDGLLEIGVPEEEVERDVQRWRQEIAPLSTVQPSPAIAWPEPPEPPPEPSEPPEEPPEPPPPPAPEVAGRDRLTRDYEEIRRRQEEEMRREVEHDPGRVNPERLAEMAGIPTELGTYFSCPHGDFDFVREHVDDEVPLCPIHQIPLVAYEQAEREDRAAEEERWRIQLERDRNEAHRLELQDRSGGGLVDRKTALDRLRDLLGQREYKVVAVERCPLRLRLFVLAAPPVPGSSVTYTESVTAERSYGWSITAVGSGTGNDRTVTAAASSTFTAAGGDRQLIFLPAVIEVADVEVRRRGQLIGRGPRTQLISPAAGDIAHQACRPLGPNEVIGEPDPFAPPEQPFDLADARPTDKPTIEESWKASSEMGISLGVTAFKLDLKCSVKIRRVREVKIGFALPGGATYRAIRLCNPVPFPDSGDEQAAPPTGGSAPLIADSGDSTMSCGDGDLHMHACLRCLLAAPSRVGQRGDLELRPAP